MGELFDDLELEKKCQKRTELAQARDGIQDQIDALSEEIGTELALRGVERAEVGEYVALLVTQRRKTLSKERLVELGVPVTTIEKATTETVSNSVRVSRRRGEGTGTVSVKEVA